jgi:hypothetical protein
LSLALPGIAADARADLNLIFSGAFTGRFDLGVGMGEIERGETEPGEIEKNGDWAFT